MKNIIHKILHRPSLKQLLCKEPAYLGDGEVCGGGVVDDDENAFGKGRDESYLPTPTTNFVSSDQQGTETKNKRRKKKDLSVSKIASLYFVLNTHVTEIKYKQFRRAVNMLCKWLTKTFV